MKQITIFLAALLVLLSSCSEKDYLNAIPGESTALISFDVQKLPLLRSVHGVDIQNKVYLFEAPDGNLGLCAAVSSQKEITKWLEKLGKVGVCQPLEEYKDYHFTVFKGSWVVGYSDQALLMMGPVVGDAQFELRRQMVKYLSQDEEKGIKGTPIFDKLDSIPSRIAMVAQAQALPEKFVAPFMLGAPKDADASQVLIAAEMSTKGGVLRIKGETFSFNRKVDAALKAAHQVFRPISGHYGEVAKGAGLMAMQVNVNGQDFLPLIQQDKGLQALLAGINTAIDMDNIIRSVDGDMIITINAMDDEHLSMAMGAELSNYRFLEDVGYWKQSCPAGGRIVDWQHGDMKLKDHKAYQYISGNTSFYFGVMPTNPALFYSGTEAHKALQMLHIPASGDFDPRVKGEKMVMTISLAGLSGDKQEATTAITSMLKPLFGNISLIEYSLK